MIAMVGNSLISNSCTLGGRIYPLRNHLPFEMAMNFEFAIVGNTIDELSRIRSEAAKSNIVFIGDSSQGTITGGTAMLGLSVKGFYGIAGNKMMVTVIDKPSTRSWAQMKAMLKSFIEK